MSIVLSIAASLLMSCGPASPGVHARLDAVRAASCLRLEAGVPAMQPPQRAQHDACGANARQCGTPPRQRGAAAMLPPSTGSTVPVVRSASARASIASATSSTPTSAPSRFARQ